MNTENKRIELPHYVKEDFTDGQEPYKWLYAFHANQFLMEQLFVRMAELAVELSVKNFPTMFKKYCASVSKPGEEPAKIENYTNFSGQKTPLKCGTWTATDTGITGLDFRGNEIEACPHPIYPSQILVNIDTNLEKVRLAFRRGNSEWRDHIFQKSTVANAQSIVKLADYGIAVNTENARALVRFLGEVENKNLDQIPSTKSVGRLGWIGEHGFSPYIADLEFDGEDEYADRFDAVAKPHGSYEKWLEAVRSIRKTESVYARIVLAASFASVLVKPTGSLPFLLHLWGMGGSGKTVCMMVAASIWANPEMGRYIKSFNSTGVGKELGSVFLNSLPLMLDELQIAATGRDKFRQMIYEFAEGVGRERGRKEGGLKKTGTWRNCMISTGEEPITDDRMTEGARYRTIEIDCGNYRFFERGNTIGDAKAVANFFQQHYGFAGRVFVENLQKDMNLASELQEIHAKEIMAIANVDRKQALSAALIITADELSEGWIFNDRIALTAADIAPLLTNKAETDQDKNALEYLYDQLAINALNFDPPAAIAAKVKIWGKVEHWKNGDGRKYLCIIKPYLKTILSEVDENMDKFLRYAKQRGLLRVAANGKTTIPTWFPKNLDDDGEANVARCIWIAIETEAGQG